MDINEASRRNTSTEGGERKDMIGRRRIKRECLFRKAFSLKNVFYTPFPISNIALSF